MSRTTQELSSVHMEFFTEILNASPEKLRELAAHTGLIEILGEDQAKELGAILQRIAEEKEVEIAPEEAEEPLETVLEELPSEELVPQEQPAEETVAEVSPNYYTVQVGDTLTSISKMVYGNPQMVKTLCEINGIIDGDKIQAGQKILLP